MPRAERVLSPEERGEKTKHVIEGKAKGKEVSRFQQLKELVGKGKDQQEILALQDNIEEITDDLLKKNLSENQRKDLEEELAGYKEELANELKKGEVEILDEVEDEDFEDKKNIPLPPKLPARDKVYDLPPRSESKAKIEVIDEDYNEEEKKSPGQISNSKNMETEINDDLAEQETILEQKKARKKLQDEIRTAFGTAEKLAAATRQAGVEKVLAAGAAEGAESARQAGAGVDQYRKESQEALINDSTRAERQAGVSEAIKAGWAERDRQLAQAKMEDASDSAAQAYADQYVPKTKPSFLSRFAAKHPAVGKIARALGLSAFVGLGVAGTVGGSMEGVGTIKAGAEITGAVKNIDQKITQAGTAYEAGIKRVSENVAENATTLPEPSTEGSVFNLMGEKIQQMGEKASEVNQAISNFSNDYYTGIQSTAESRYITPSVPEMIQIAQDSAEKSMPKTSIEKNTRVSADKYGWTDLRNDMEILKANQRGTLSSEHKQELKDATKRAQEFTKIQLADKIKDKKVVADTMAKLFEGTGL